jgi:hypothetical protein
MDYKEFLNERKAGMIVTIESMESPCLEAFKRRQREEGEKAAKSFFSFLKKKNPELAEECKKEPNKIIQMVKNKSKEFKQWSDEHELLSSVLLGAITAGVLKSATIGAFIGVGSYIGKKLPGEGDMTAADHAGQMNHTIAAMHMM